MIRLVKFLWLFILLLIIYLNTNAQVSVGIETGIVKNYLITNSIQSFTKYEGSTGMSLGIPIFLNVNTWFSILVDPNYLQKNYKKVRTITSS